MNNNKIYRIENNERIYKYESSIEEMFYSEMCIHMHDHLNFETKIYYLQCSSKHNFSLNNSELEYLYTLDARYTEALNYVFSNNVKNIKCFQRSDLFFLTNLKHLYFICLIPKLDKDNRFYFNILLGVKQEFEIKQFYNWDLKSVCILNVIQLNSFNLNESYLKNIFDLLNNKFKDHRITEEESKIYQKYFTLGLQNIDSKLTAVGRRIYSKIIFKQVCFHFYWMCGECQKKNTQFWVDHGYKDKIIVPNKNGSIQIHEFYHPSSLEDMMLNLPEYICFAAWEYYKNF